MKKSIKKLLGTVLTAAMCFALLPVQTVKAEENDNFAALTEEQVKEILFGTWMAEGEDEGGDEEEAERVFGEQVTFDDGSEDSIAYYYGVDVIDRSESGFVEIVVTYATDIEKHAALIKADENTDVKDAVHFDATVYLYCYKDYEYNATGYFSCTGHGEWEKYEPDYADLMYKILENGETATLEDLLKQALADGAKAETNTEVKEDVTTENEKDTQEEVKEDAVIENEEDAKEDAKEKVNVTPNGREMAEGETYYIVKKGDCLWGIARTLLGDGRKYKELFTRNNDIVEKAVLIFPGQEIIIPAK